MVILKCLIYKNSNALKSFKFFKSLKYCLRRFESANLIRRDNRTDKSTVRLEPDAIQKLGKVEYKFISHSISEMLIFVCQPFKVKCLDHSALSICKESRYIDGFMPLTMTALASISGKFQKPDHFLAQAITKVRNLESRKKKITKSKQ